MVAEGRTHFTAPDGHEYYLAGAPPAMHVCTCPPCTMRALMWGTSVIDGMVDRVLALEAVRGLNATWGWAAKCCGT